MEYIFGNLMKDGGLLTYFDDCLIWEADPVDVRSKLERFLERVEYHGLSLSAKEKKSALSATAQYRSLA